MPIYEYLCKECQHELEEMQKFNDAPLTECPQCTQSSLERILSKSAFHLKGGGWYQDGYGRLNPAKTDDKAPQPPTNATNLSQSSQKTTPTTS